MNNKETAQAEAPEVVGTELEDKSVEADAPVDPAVEQADTGPEPETSVQIAAPESVAEDQDVKVMVQIKNGVAAIGVQRPDTDVYIEVFSNRDLFAIVDEIVPTFENAQAQWEDSPTYPKYRKPRRRATSNNSRRQSTAASKKAEEKKAEEEKPGAQQQMFDLL